MTNPFLGEVRMVGFNFAPVGWNFCDGSLQSIANNNALYALVGTTYGGDGQSTFGLPDFRGRVPVHQGTGGGLSTRTLGQLSGAETVTLTTSQLPQHGHAPVANNVDATVDAPAATAMPAKAKQATGGNSATFYTDPTVNPVPPGDFKPMQANIITNSGSSQAHANTAPSLAVNFIIAMQGVFPTQN